MKQKPNAYWNKISVVYVSAVSILIFCPESVHFETENKTRY